MIALVTAATLPDLCEDDHPFLGALTEVGVPFDVVVWDDPDLDWSRYSDVVVRSPWDYPARPDEFLAWYERVARIVPVHNDVDLVRRNLHKRYLVELADAGVGVVPTVVVASQSAAQRVAVERGWTQAVIKPAIGLGGRSVAIFRADAPPSEIGLQGAATEWCVQPYVASIRTEGEYSVVLVAGEARHALLKKPGPHDFRVHDGRGGTHAGCPLTEELRAAAHAVTTAYGADDALFARVDLIRDGEGRLVLMELDVTSPCLYTEHHPDLAGVFAEAVAARVSGAGGRGTGTARPRRGRGARDRALAPRPR